MLIFLMDAVGLMEEVAEAEVRQEALIVLDDNKIKSYRVLLI